MSGQRAAGAVAGARSAGDRR